MSHICSRFLEILEMSQAGWRYIFVLLFLEFLDISQAGWRYIFVLGF